MANLHLRSLRRIRGSSSSLLPKFSSPISASFRSVLLLPPSIPSNVQETEPSWRVFERKPRWSCIIQPQSFCSVGQRWISVSPQLRAFSCKAGKPVENPSEGGGSDSGGEFKPKRQKLKGKKAVMKWLKLFRYNKKKEYERMTAEEKLLFKLMKAQRKEERLTDALMKIEPKDLTETVHDPEVLTPEEHFYYLKMGHKSKNYVPIGRRGVYQGVILNMHLHWKKHQTLKVIVKTFTPQEVREIASELARLSGGIVLDIHEENTIIMYRGKNYSQPPTEIMSPRITLPRKKALDKSKHRDGLRAVRLYILKLEEDLELLQAKAKRERESKSNCTNEENPSKTIDDGGMNRNFEGFGTTSPEEENFLEEDSMSESGLISESEDLSDIFEMDSEAESGEESQKPLYLDTFEKFPSHGDADLEDFEEHLRQNSTKSKKRDSHGEAEELPELDEIDRIFLNVGSLVNKKRR